MLCTQTARNDSYFNTLIEKDNGKIILINFGNVFKNNMLFGNDYHSEGKLAMFINWFKAVGPMKKFKNNVFMITVKTTVRNLNG